MVFEIELTDLQIPFPDVAHNSFVLFYICLLAVSNTFSILIVLIRVRMYG